MREVILPFPKDLAPVTQVRSTVICASLQALRTHGRYDAYLSLLSEAKRQEVIALTPGAWLPGDRAVTHYLTCDRLPIDRAERLEIGLDVGRRLQKSSLNVLARLSQQAGTDPWTLVIYADRLRERNFTGSGIQVTKVGPKDAHIEWRLQPCARSVHFTVGFMGHIKGLCELFCRRAFVSEDSRRCNETTFAMQLSWA